MYACDWAGQNWGSLLCLALPLGLHRGCRTNTTDPPLLHSADAASGEAMALSTAGMLAAGWFLLEFVRSEQTQETTENPARGWKSLPYQETHF